MENKAFQASINFIIVMIIGIAILGLGFTFFSNLFTKTKQINKQMSASHQRQLNKMMDNGNPVAILRPNRNVQPGTSEIFQIGITNTKSTSKTFKLHANCQTTMCTINNNDLTYQKTTFTLQPNERDYKMINVKVPGDASEGTKIINVTACIGNTCSKTSHYYHPVKIYVNVP